MPTYEYRCTACGHAFERFQPMTAEPIRKCPECGKNKVKRLLGTGAGLIFKGSGFYITDYRSESYKNAAKAETGTPAGGESKSDSAAAAATSTTDAKAAAAAATASTPAPAPKSESKPAPKKGKK
jgi:putative FmdB family regulatory protein